MSTTDHTPGTYFSLPYLDSTASITTRRHTDGRPIVDFPNNAGSPFYLWIGSAGKARELLAAAFEAVKILDPDGAGDAVLSLPLAGECLDKARQRIAEDDGPAPADGDSELPPQHADDEPICGAGATGIDPFVCTAVAAHTGDHVAYGMRHANGQQGPVCHTWPQEPERECASCHATGEPVNVVTISHEGRMVRIFLCQDADACYARRDQRHSETAKAGA